VSEKSLRNETNHGSFGPGDGPAGHARGFGMEPMQKDRVWRKLLVHWFAVEKQNGNSGLKGRSTPHSHRIPGARIGAGPQ